jgi:hypothetical protein
MDIVGIRTDDLLFLKYVGFYQNQLRLEFQVSLDLIRRDKLIIILLTKVTKLKVLNIFD